MITEIRDCFKEIETIKSIPLIDNTFLETKFTFGVPTYKRARCLVEALDSIISQHSQIKYNIIISDNNPTRDDETETIMHNYKDVPGLKYFKHEKAMTPAANWNKLFSLCPSDYLIMVHDDDVVLPDFLDSMSKVLIALPNASFIKCKSYRWKGDSVDNTIFKASNRIIQHTINSIYFNFSLSPTGSIMNRRDIIEIGGFDDNYTPAIDYVLCIRLLMKGKEVYSFDNVLLKYRIVNNDTYRPETQRKLAQIDKVIKTELGKYLKYPQPIIKYSIFLRQWIYQRAIDKMEGKSRSLWDIYVSCLYILTVYLKKIICPIKVVKIQ